MRPPFPPMPGYMRRTASRAQNMLPAIVPFIGGSRGIGAAIAQLTAEEGFYTALENAFHPREEAKQEVVEKHHLGRIQPPKAEL